MARIDSLIKGLYGQAVPRAILKPDEAVVLDRGDTQQVLEHMVLAESQLEKLLDEVLPEHAADELYFLDSVAYNYDSPHGAVRLEARREDKRLAELFVVVTGEAAPPNAPFPPGHFTGRETIEAPSVAEYLSGYSAGIEIEDDESEPEEARRTSPGIEEAAPGFDTVAFPSPASLSLPLEADEENSEKEKEEKKKMKKKVAPPPIPEASKTKIWSTPDVDRPIPMAPHGERLPIHGFFEAMVEQGCSDLHLSSKNPPLYRKDGAMVQLHEMAPLQPEQITELLLPIMPDKNFAEFRDQWDTDFAYELEGAGRFRCNVFMDRHGPGAVFRIIPEEILTAEELGLSEEILDLCFLTKGLVVVTGPTGSGKSTTLAALIDYINRKRSAHIITIEDPIEFVHPNKECLINQREVGLHTKNFKNALRAALREDPDIVLVGEMRDLETIAIAIETAETGHLVFGTLHTNTAASTVDRIIDQFPADRQAQIRTMLSESLRAVIAQTLCKKTGGGRVAALEVLLCNHAVSNLIREGKTFQIPSTMETGKGAGMMTLKDSLMALVEAEVITPEEGLAKSIDRGAFRKALKQKGYELEVD